MFELDRAAVKISSVTNVGEKHGNDRVSGKGVAVKVILPNTSLNDLLPGLREALYRAPARKDGTLDLPDNNLCELRFPHMGPFAWDYEGEGWIAKFIIGTTGDRDVWMTPAKLSKITVNPMEGGSVEYSISIYGRLNETIHHGILDEQVQRECNLTTEKPSPVSDTDDMFPSDASPTPAKDKHDEQRAALDEIFGEPTDEDGEKE